MKKLAILFTGSYRELRSTRTITTAAMLGAVSVVLGYFSVQLGDFIRISFSSLANQIVYYLFGPMVGGVFGGVLDVLKYLMKPTGGFFPGFTLGTLWLSMLYGKAFMVLLPVRVVKNLVMWPINSALFFVVVKTMEGAGVFRMVRGSEG